MRFSMFYQTEEVKGPGKGPSKGAIQRKHLVDMCMTTLR